MGLSFSNGTAFTPIAVGLRCATRFEDNLQRRRLRSRVADEGLFRCSLLSGNDRENDRCARGIDSYAATPGKFCARQSVGGIDIARSKRRRARCRGAAKVSPHRTSNSPAFVKGLTHLSASQSSAVYCNTQHKRNRREPSGASRIKEAPDRLWQISWIDACHTNTAVLLRPLTHG
jgi:hypothetical protein